MGGALGLLWRALFPARCLGCGLRDQVVCPACAASIQPRWLGLCPGCARPQRSGRPCPACADHPGPLDRLLVGTAYQGVARRAILTLKFRGGRYVAPTLAALLADGVAARAGAIDLVVPVPLSSARLRRRGYNQAALLAHELLRLDPLGGATLHPEALCRVRDTHPQVGLGAAERQHNVRDAFRCESPALVAGRRVLLIDDVCTTGATLRACADVLRLAGARRIRALVVAHEL